MLGSSGQLQRHQARLDGRGIGGCPNVGGICIGCTMPGFPDKFMPFMDPPPGAAFSSAASGTLRLVMRALRSITKHTVNKEPDGVTGSELTPAINRHYGIS